MASLLIFSYLFLVIGLIGALVIIFRKIPVLLKLPSQPDESYQKLPLNNKASNLIKGIPSSPRYGLALLNITEKLLRRVRILFLRLDNFFVALINRSRNKSHDLAIKSKEWMSARRMKKIEKLKLMASLRTTPEQKEEGLLRSLRHNPKDIKAYKELGALYLEQKNYQDATAAFEEVLKINPEDESAKEKLEEIKNLESGTGKQESGHTPA